MTSLLKRAMYLCFFLSGMNALIYEVAWLNRIQLVMGHTIYSLATTLAAYMSGLALGSLFVPRLKKTGINPLFLYLFAELFIGVYGLFFYPLLKLVEIPYGFIVSEFQFSLLSLSLIQFVFCAILIVIPTFLMGTTLPLVAPFIYPDKNGVSEDLPVLYGVNTLGAMVGSLLTGYLILPGLGYSKTIQLAAGINISIYLIMCLFIKNLKKGAEKDHISLESHLEGAPKEDFPSFWTLKTAVGKIFSKSHDRKRKWDWSLVNPWCLAVLFVSGFVSMTTQSIWNRLAALSFGPHVYIFSLITSVVLAGIAIGSWGWRKWKGDEERTKRLFILLPCLAGISLLVCNSLFAEGPRVVLDWNQKIKPGFELRTFFELLWSIFCLLPAAVFQGALFPAATTQLTHGQDSEQSTYSLGVGYALNIAGLILGAVLGAFVLFPYLGIEKMTQGICMSLFLLSALLAFGLGKFFQVSIATIALGCVSLSIVPSFDWGILTAGFFYNREQKMTDETLHELGWMDAVSFFKSRKAVMLVKHDDPHATISIHRGNLDKNYRSFKINGKVDGTNSVDLRTTRLLSAYPALAKFDAQSTLIIGLGTGSTAANMLKYPNMKSVKVIEISSAMIEYARKYFSNVDGYIWGDPRFSIEYSDGRNYLERMRNMRGIAAEDKPHLIISEPSNPYVDGVGSLFTKEFFETVSEVLAPGGVASLWFHTYGLDCQAVQSVLLAAAKAFPSFLVFKQSGDLFLLASNKSDGLVLKPLVPETSELKQTLFQEAGVSGGFSTSDQEQYRSVIEKTLLYDRDDVLNLDMFSPVNTDDNGFLQFRSGKTFSLDVDCRDFQGSAGRELIQRYSLGF